MKVKKMVGRFPRQIDTPDLLLDLLDVMSAKDGLGDGSNCSGHFQICK